MKRQLAIILTALSFVLHASSCESDISLGGWKLVKNENDKLTEQLVAQRQEILLLKESLKRIESKMDRCERELNQCSRDLSSQKTIQKYYSNSPFKSR